MIHDLESIARALGGDVFGSEVLAPGPGHSPGDRSLSIKLSGRSGKSPDGFIVHSYAGDDWQICRDYTRSRLGLPAFAPQVSAGISKPIRLSPEALATVKGAKPNGETKVNGAKAKPVRTFAFDFRDPASGEVRYRKVRRDFADRTKEIFFDPKGRGGSPSLLFGGEHLSDLAEGKPVWIVEGENKVEAMRARGAVAISGDTGAQSKWRPDHAALLRGLPVILWPDSDEPGETYIANAAAAILAENPSADIRVVRPFPLIESMKGKDVCDWDGTDEDLAALAASAEPFEAAPERSNPPKGAGAPNFHDKRFEPGFGSFGSDRGRGFSENTWPEPKPVPEGLLPVASFDSAFLPDAIAPWVMDISDRMQCPPDFVAIPAIVALGSIIGRKVAIRPQRRTDWYEVANLWGFIVGRPGVLKSPAMLEALKPLNRLEAKAREENAAAAKSYALEVEFSKIKRDDAARRAKKNIGLFNASDLAIDEPNEPKARRYVVNDATYEALGVILADNPNGTLAFRDELVSLLKTLDREENISARGFFLTAWNGTSGYTFDRIIRGKTHIEAACLSLLGSTQPGRLAEYMRGALSGGAGDDGMIQRFSLLVWPDHNADWREADRYPDSESRAAAWRVFQYLDEMTLDETGAQTDEFEKIPFLRFDDDALDIFREWRGDLERKLRSGDLAPSLESHLAKYRKLVPALALINQIADGGAGPIGEAALLRALALSQYLETHARRAYGAGSEIETSAAKAILKHIRKGDLRDAFTGRDVHRPRWSDLSDRGHVQAGLDLLCDFDWLKSEPRPAAASGGRPSVAYRINPRAVT
jgi:Protein of unknown function (DUF3987)